MDAIMEIITPAVTTALTQIFLGLLSLLMVFIGKKFAVVLDTRVEREFAEMVVQTMEMLGNKLGWTGPEKKAEALKQLSLMLKEKGIRVSDAQLHILIESMVKQFKYGFGEIPAPTDKPQS